MSWHRPKYCEGWYLLTCTALRTCRHSTSSGFRRRGGTRGVGVLAHRWREWMPWHRPEYPWGLVLDDVHHDVHHSLHVSSFHVEWMAMGSLCAIWGNGARA